MEKLMTLMTITDTEVRIIMWVAGGLITVLFFFLSFHFARSITIQDKLNEAINKLQISISGMNAIIESMQDEKSDFKKYYDLRHKELQDQVDEVETTVIKHGERITCIETKLNIVKT